MLELLSWLLLLLPLASAAAIQLWLKDDVLLHLVKRKKQMPKRSRTKALNKRHPL